MKKRTILNTMNINFSRWLAVIAGLLFLGSSTLHAQVNTNWDFSQSTLGDSTTADWWILGEDFADHEFIKDPDDSTNILLQTTLTDTASVDNPWDVQVTSVNTLLEANSTYVISGRIKFISSDSESGVLNFVSGDVGLNQYGAAINHNEWTVFAFDTVYTDTAVTANVGFHLADPSIGNGDIFQIDYISVAKIEEPTEEPSTPEDFVNANGDFSDSELGPTTGTPNWWILGTDYAEYEIIEDPDNAPNRLLKAKLTDVGSVTNAWDIQAVNTGIQFEANSKYVVSARFKYISSTGASTGSISFDPGPAVGGARYGVSIPSGEWTVITLDTVKTDTAFIANIGLHLGFESHANGDSTYIDYIKVEKYSEVSTYPDSIPEPPYAVGEIINYNGSLTFSDSGATAPENWTISAATGSSVEVTDDAADGDERALVFNVSWNSSTNWYENEVVNEPINVVQGEKYRVSAYMKADSEGRIGRMYLGMPESGGWERARGFETPQLTLNTEYKEFSFEHVASASNETNGMRVGIEFNNEVNDGATITIDNVRVTKLPNVVEKQEPIAKGKNKWLGNIYSSPQIQNFESYWNQVTPENAGKWGSVEGTRDQMNWGGLDAAYNLAKDNGFPFRFHILIWGGQQPGWINDLSSEEQLEEIEEWMDAVAERYDDLDYVEVVNEGSNGHQLPDGQSGEANYIEALGGTGETGFDWIITAFEMARERFPNSKLMINDYNIVSSVSWGSQAARNYKRIIDELKSRGLIDAIGVQAHAFSTVGTQAEMRSVLNLLAETGLPIQATELDIDGDANAIADATSDAKQLENIKRIFPVFWEHPAVEGVTMWGWRSGMWRTDQDAFLIRDDGGERPALNWLRAYVDTANVQFSVSNEIEETLPGEFKLDNNYPNPFNPSTSISYQIPAAADVKINVYDITGRLVQSLVNARQSAGSYTINFNASALSTGVYFYELRAGSFRDVKKMTLIK